MKEVLAFLEDLVRNNNREWFEANKALYKYATEYTNDLALRMIAGIAEFDPSVKDLTLKDVTYRIYRDVRFAKDKSPYKTHIGIYVCKGGKKSWNSGYYLHIEPKLEGITEGPMASSGIYMPSPETLKNLREAILENGGKFESALKKSYPAGFLLDKTNTLKRNPAGFPEGKYDELIRLKDLYVFKRMDPAELLKKDFLEGLIADYKTTYDLIHLLNEVSG